MGWGGGYIKAKTLVLCQSARRLASIYYKINLDPAHLIFCMIRSTVEQSIKLMQIGKTLYLLLSVAAEVMNLAKKLAH